MNKIEYMAMSLPFGLKLQAQSSNKYNRNILNYYELVGINGNEYTCKLNLIYHFNIDAVKPVLRRLLEFENSGFDIQDELLVDNLISGFSIDSMPFYLIKCLVENHFDFLGLIDKNEAIDYSTLEGFSF